MGLVKKFLKKFQKPKVIEKEVPIIPKPQMKRIVIVGDGACGKTSLIKRYLHHDFTPDNYSPTIFEVQTRNIQDEIRPIQLVICDTAGQKEYDSLRPSLYFRSDVIVVCFSMDNPNSLANIRDRWKAEICRFCDDVPIILVGTKSDLATETNNTNVERCCEKCKLVSKFGDAMAALIGAEKYIECSALTDNGVTDIFEEALSLALAHDVKLRRKSSFKRRGSLFDTLALLVK
ncbi:hypothetical protein SNE40_018491 [Patella caerulea]|uniref:Rho GTPase n=1 Tax=Patella caerulea TaxID=87958 RepID=A0AAN8J5N8_PATCE